MNKNDFVKLDEILECGIFFDKGYPQIKDINKLKANINNIFDRKIASNEDLFSTAFYLIYSVAWKLNIYLSSLQKVNKAQANHEFSDHFKIPALDITEDSISILRHLFSAMNREETKLLALIINPKEMDQNWFFPFILKILAAAILEEYSGPIFLQTDIYFDPLSFENTRDNLIDQLKKKTQKAIKSGIYNLNLDASDLVDQEKSVISEKMLMNLKMVAMATNLWVRNYQPNGITVSVSGKIGKGAAGFIKADEIKDYLKRLLKEGSRLRFVTAGEDISKIVVDYGGKNISTADQIGLLNTVSQNEFGLGGIVLDLGIINNLSQFTQFTNYDVCELRGKLADNLKKENSYQEIIHTCNIQKKIGVSDKYAMKMIQFPRPSDY